MRAMVDPLTCEDGQRRRLGSGRPLWRLASVPTPTRRCYVVERVLNELSTPQPEHTQHCRTNESGASEVGVRHCRDDKVARRCAGTDPGGKRHARELQLCRNGLSGQVDSSADGCVPKALR